MNIRDIQHDLRRDFHNIMSLIKFLNEEEISINDDIKSMMSMCLERETDTISNINLLSDLVRTNKV